MTNEPNEPKISMAQMRDITSLNILQTEEVLQRLNLLRIDLELYRGDSSEMMDKRHELFEAHQKVSDVLRVLHQALKDTEPKD